MNITFTNIDFTGTPDSDDRLAANHIVFLENKRITTENARRAALSPPEPPLPLLPTSPALALKSSYLGLLKSMLVAAHLSYIAQAKSADGTALRFTEEEQKQIRSNLIARLNAGESPASIIADTATL